MSAAGGWTATGAAPWLWAVAGLVVVAIAAWWELSRPGPRRGLRAVAAATAVLAIVAIGLRPARLVETPRAEAILITPGAQPADLDRLLDSLPGLRVLSLAGAEPWSRRAPVEVLGAAAEVPFRHPAVGVLHVLGWGLDRGEIADLDGIELHPRPSAPPPGIVDPAWPRTVALGAPVTVRGSVTGLERAAWVRLVGPGGVADSARVTPESTAFALEDLPRDAGRHLYRLDIPGTAVAESLGAEVMSDPPPPTLVLDASPSFETRELRRWLAARGGAVAVRTTVSRGRWRTEHVNLPAEPLGRLRRDLLERFAVLVLDGRTLATLSAGETAAVRAAVDAGRLGVIVRADESLFRGSGRRARWTEIEGAAIDGLDERLVRPVWDGQLRAPATPVPAEPWELLPAGAGLPLMRDASGRIVAQTYPSGLGRITATVVAGPSRWLREGERDAFAAYWSRLIEASAGRGGSTIRLTDRHPARVDRSVELELRTTDAVPRLVVEDPAGRADTVRLAADPLDGERWVGRYWPRAGGWHRVTAGDGDTGRAFHVADAGAWHAAAAAERLAVTAAHAGRRDAGAVAAPATAPVPLPRGWMFGLFLAAVGGLWSLPPGGAGTRRRLH